jgi:hypothetical protein
VPASRREFLDPIATKLLSSNPRITSRIQRVILAALLLPLLAAAVPSDKRAPDVVELKNGTKVEGRVLFQDDAQVIVRVGSRDREIPRKEVAIVRSRVGDLHAVLERWNALTSPDAAALLDLAKSCVKTDLTDEAEAFAWRALLVDPKNEEAHKLLGHELHSGVWSVHEGTKSIPFAGIESAHKEWKNPWSFASTHYKLRTNLDLSRATSMLFDLEGYYSIFFDAFATELRLYDVIEPMNAHVHADQKSYPELVSYRNAYFDISSNTLLVNAANGFSRRVLFHEATHELLYNTAEHMKNSRGEIPSWLNEGLAEYMAYCVEGTDGRPAFTPGAIARAHFKTHAEARQPLDLARVLTLSSGDFAASSLADLKYSEAYTLVHFLLHGENGKHRKGFLDFVRGTYKGQSSSTSFRDAMGGHERELEQAWVAYVKATASGGVAAKPAPK